MNESNRRFQTSIFFFFNDTATTEIYTLSLHDALPILCLVRPREAVAASPEFGVDGFLGQEADFANVRLGRGGNVNLKDRKSTRLNSSHGYISYAVFCLKKKKNIADVHSVPIHVMIERY